MINMKPVENIQKIWLIFGYQGSYQEEILVGLLRLAEPFSDRGVRSTLDWVLINRIYTCYLNSGVRSDIMTEYPYLTRSTKFK